MTAKRVDANQNEIVKALRDLGCSVFVLSDVGKGFPDIIAGWRNKNFLFEIKDGAKPKSKQKLTPAEILFFQSWQGQAFIVNSVDQAIEYVLNDG